jgi:1,4-dihydroxy-2-naphthoyl-CoA hydrolase
MLDKDGYVEPGLERFLDFDNGRNFHNYIGLKWTHIARGKIGAKLIVTPDFQQPMGLLHGGVSIAIAEGVASFGGMILADSHNSSVVGLEINGNHMTSVPADQNKVIIAEGKVLHQGKTTQVWEVTIRTEDTKKLVCVSRMTAFLLPRSKM